MYIYLVLKACCPSRINYSRMENNVYSPRSRCCLNRMEAIVTQVALKAMYISLVRKACCPSRINYTRMESNVYVYLVLKRVVRVETKAMHHFHCSTCIPSGTEGYVHFACSKITLPKWSGKQYTLMFTYLVRKRVACVEIHRLMYPYLTLFESVLHVWNGLRHIIYLPRSKACFPSGTERNVTFPSLGNIFLLL